MHFSIQEEKNIIPSRFLVLGFLLFIYTGYLAIQFYINGEKYNLVVLGVYEREIKSCRSHACRLGLADEEVGIVYMHQFELENRMPIIIQSMSKYKVGSTQDVIYLPKNPKRSTIDSYFYQNPYLHFTIATFIFVIGLYLDRDKWD